MSELKEEDVDFVDMENYKGSGSAAITPQIIILNQFNKAIREGSKEMTTGGVQQRFVNGEIQEWIVPNQKEIFGNTVQNLYIALDRHKDMPAVKVATKEEFKNIDIERQKINDWFSKQIDIINKNYMGKINSRIPNIRMRGEGNFNSMLNNLKEQREYKEMELNKRLLRACSQLLYDIEYLGEQTISG